MQDTRTLLDLDQLQEQTLDYLRQLVGFTSVTPDQTACLDTIADHLKARGFQPQVMQHGQVKNLWARTGGQGPMLAWMGHSDVVPSGPLDLWRTDPFCLHIDKPSGRVFGRGVADMKGAIAAMMAALDQIHVSVHDGSPALGVLITGDEEGSAIDGTVRVLEHLDAMNQNLDAVLIGEPSSEQRTGDTLIVGRRGSMHVHITITGMAGHIGYPSDLDNPIHRFSPCLQHLITHVWDEGNDDFEPTQFQCYDLRSTSSACNITPDNLILQANFRFSPCSNVSQLLDQLNGILKTHGMRYHMSHTVSGPPYHSQPGWLRKTLDDEIASVCGMRPEHSTKGATSDGRFLSGRGIEICELGLPRVSIHQANEYTTIDDLQNLAILYHGLINRWLHHQKP